MPACCFCVRLSPFDPFNLINSALEFYVFNNNNYYNPDTQVKVTNGDGNAVSEMINIKINMTV